jgi:excinuclease ABC subunit B
LSARARAAAAAAAVARRGEQDQDHGGGPAREDLVGLITELTEQMHTAAAELQFEIAARLRDEIKELKHELRGMQAAGV